MRYSSAFIGLTLLSLSLPEQVAAQQVKFRPEALPEESQRRIASERTMVRLFGINDPSKTKKGVVNALKLWNYQVDRIRVCFFDGTKAARANVVKVGSEWTSAVPGLPLDFGNPEDPRLCASGGDVNHIRISFKLDGYWSHLGTDSIRVVGQTQPSMNLGGLDTVAINHPEFRSTVLHEFGHAIGFNHEHQNPMSTCREEFNWQLIKADLNGPPNNWNDARIEFNMGELHEPGLLATEFDSASIMLYTFPRQFFKPESFAGGKVAKCFSETNTKLSPGDVMLARLMYPVELAAKKAVVQQIREHLNTLVKESGQSDGAKSGIVQMINQLMPAQ
jgi:hypothetical protein